MSVRRAFVERLFLELHLLLQFSDLLVAKQILAVVFDYLTMLLHAIFVATF